MDELYFEDSDKGTRKNPILNGENKQLNSSFQTNSDSDRNQANLHEEYKSIDMQFIDKFLPKKRVSLKNRKDVIFK